MTGMKEGAGEDPFADDDEGTDEVGLANSETEGQVDTPSPTQQRSSRQQAQIPYKFRRDSVQDGRNRVPLFLQEDTKRAERDLQRELEDRFDENVSTTDLREALIKVGLGQQEKVASQLEDWGYGMTFE